MDHGICSGLRLRQQKAFVTLVLIVSDQLEEKDLYALPSWQPSSAWVLSECMEHDHVQISSGIGETQALVLQIVPYSAK